VTIPKLGTKPVTGRAKISGLEVPAKDLARTVKLKTGISAKSLNIPLRSGTASGEGISVSVRNRPNGLLSRIPRLTKWRPELKLSVEDSRSAEASPSMLHMVELAPYILAIPIFLKNRNLREVVGTSTIVTSLMTLAMDASEAGVPASKIVGGGLILYAGAGLASRFYIKGLEVANNVIRKIFRQKKTEDLLADFDPSSLPYLKDVYSEYLASVDGEYESVAEGLDSLAETIEADRELAKFLGIIPYQVRASTLLRMLDGVKVQMGKYEVTRPDGKKESLGGGFVAAYLPFAKTLFLGPKTQVETIRHEITHALHHLAIERAMTPEGARHISKIFPEHIPESERDACVKEAHGIVTAFAETSGRKDALPTEVREAAAKLYLELGLKYHRDKVEALATVTETKGSGPWRRFTKWMVNRVFMRLTAFFYQPIGVLGGYGKRNSFHQVLHAYGNKRLYHQLLSEGPLDSLDPTAQPQQSAIQKLKTWFLDLIS